MHDTRKGCKNAIDIQHWSLGTRLFLEKEGTGDDSYHIVWESGKMTVKRGPQGVPSRWTMMWQPDSDISSFEVCRRPNSPGLFKEIENALSKFLAPALASEMPSIIQLKTLNPLSPRRNQTNRNAAHTDYYNPGMSLREMMRCICSSGMIQAQKLWIVT
jgi:hypothetical protein